MNGSIPRVSEFRNGGVWLCMVSYGVALRSIVRQGNKSVKNKVIICQYMRIKTD